uniref:Uncharacterized protein n=1 Tax=Anguilla anguilla TaxID=7936 RepID=A0A0E9X458_ANGAN
MTCGSISQSDLRDSNNPALSSVPRAELGVCHSFSTWDRSRYKLSIQVYAAYRCIGTGVCSIQVYACRMWIFFVVQSSASLQAPCTDTFILDH